MHFKIFFGILCFCFIQIHVNADMERLQKQEYKARHTKT